MRDLPAGSSYLWVRSALLLADRVIRLLSYRRRPVSTAEVDPGLRRDDKQGGKYFIYTIKMTA
jgi:hypothetical protein